MNDIEFFLRREGYAYDATFRQNENDMYMKDFFRGDSRITVVELVDKYQIMVYDGKTIKSSTQPTEHFVVEYLKGIL
jgi:ribosomal protein S8